MCHAPAHAAGPSLCLSQHVWEVDMLRLELDTVLLRRPREASGCLSTVLCLAIYSAH